MAKKRLEDPSCSFAMCPHFAWHFETLWWSTAERICAVNSTTAHLPPPEDRAKTLNLCTRVFQMSSMGFDLGAQVGRGSGKMPRAHKQPARPSASLQQWMAWTLRPFNGGNLSIGTLFLPGGHLVWESCCHPPGCGRFGCQTAMVAKDGSLVRAQKGLGIVMTDHQKQLFVFRGQRL